MKNSLHFKSLAEQLEIAQNDTLVSFDVQSLFTNVPVPETLAIIEKRLVSDSQLSERTNLPIPTIMELITMCAETTYFQFKDMFYRQVDGMAMGSSLSPFMANIFMENFEQEALAETDTPPKVWLRYVDDTFLVWQHGMEKLKDFAEFLNSRRSTIQFTYETERDQALPFLDVLVCRKDNVITTKVYRKPTHTGQYLHFKSNHSNSTKSGIIRTLVMRAENVCSQGKEKVIELNRVKQELLSNGYPQSAIKKEMSKNPSFQFQQESRTSPIATMVIPYVRGLSEKIRRLAGKHNIRTAFKSGSTIKTFTTKVRPRCDQKHTKECVYEIPCQCGNVYIGETGRPLSVRLKEHQRNIRQGEIEKSRLAEHVWAESHNILWDKSQPIAREQNAIKRKIKESAFICSNRNVISQQSIELKNIWLPVIKKETTLPKL